MSQWAATGQRPASPVNSIFTINAWFVFGGVCFVYLFFNWYLQTQVLTLGLFWLVINAVMIKLAAAIVPRGH